MSGPCPREKPWPSDGGMVPGWENSMGSLMNPSLKLSFFFGPYRNCDGLGHGTGPFCRQQRLLQPLTFLFLSGSVGCFLGLCTWQPQSFIPQTGIEH